MKRSSVGRATSKSRRYEGWIRRGRFLVKTRTFADFREAIAWVLQVAQLAERLNHHPDIEIRWNCVTLRLITHDAGGLTDKDWHWAETEVEELGYPSGGGSQRKRQDIQSF